MQRRATDLFVTVLLACLLILAGCGNGGAATPDSSAAIPEGTVGAADLASVKTGEGADLSTTGTSGSQTASDKAGNRSGDATSRPETDEPNDGSENGPEGRLEVHFIDVGQGASQLIIGPTGKTMLIDGGDNDMEETVVRYLREQGIRKVDIVIGTHPHADHIGGLDAVVDHFDIGKIYMPRVQSNTRTFESLLLAIQRKGLNISTAKAGVVLDWEPDVDVTMVAPVGTYDNLNDMSAVVHLAYGQTAFLFTGDAEAGSEADILESGATIRADVLMIGHHGSNTSTTRAFLEKVAPTYGVIQVGENSYEHPSENVLNRLSEQGVHVFRNDLHGTVVFTSDGETITVEQHPSKGSGVQTPAEEPSGETASALPAPETSGEEAKGGDWTATAGIDNPAPPQNSQVTVTVKATDENGQPVSGADVKLLLHYKSTKTEYEGTTNASGVADIPFRIGRAAKGFTVKGEITVTKDGKQATTTVSFTPE